MRLDDDAERAGSALLERFFRRRDEAGKFDCPSGLVAQVRQCGSRAFSLAAVQATVQDAFKRPDELQLKLVGTCEACQKTRSFIGRRDQDHRTGVGPQP